MSKHSTMVSGPEWLLKLFKTKGALFVHDYNPIRPHVLLASGFHSPCYFWADKIVNDPNALEEVASNLFFMLRTRCEFHSVDVVIGVPTGATKLAEAISSRIANLSESGCMFGSPEKILGADGRKEMAFNEEARERLKNKRVLVCEDVLTTGGSTNLVIDAINKAGGEVTPFLVAIVNRSGLNYLGEMKIVSLARFDRILWKPEECPLCKNGSQAIPGKFQKLFTATY